MYNILRSVIIFYSIFDTYAFKQLVCCSDLGHLHMSSNGPISQQSNI